jgi:hypothetical protein
LFALADTAHLPGSGTIDRLILALVLSRSAILNALRLGIAQHDQQFAKTLADLVDPSLAEGVVTQVETFD